MAQESLNPFEIAQRLVDGAAERLTVPDGLKQVLRSSRSQTVAAVPVLLDDGSVRVLEGYRVVHSTARGPALGGLRFHAKITPDELKAQAAVTSWTAAVAGVPLGGAAGGLACDPRRLSRGELERATRRYAAEVAALSGDDILSPDLGTDAQTMAWLHDTWAALGARRFAVGRPVVLGGPGPRAELAARAALFGIREACQGLRKPMRGTTVAVQGFGSVGGALARQLHDEGARLIAVGDSRGGLQAGRGLDPRLVAEHDRQAGSVVGFKGAERVTNEELLESKCDVLILAALEGQVTMRNAGRLRARVVAEVAPGGVTPGADRVLHERGVLLVPDLLCGVGAAVASYLEWGWARQGMSWDEEAATRHIERATVRAFREAQEQGRRHKGDLRLGALLLGVWRVAEATRLRGLFP
jgi:glutamate dehydrogenase (NAD(P)+)